LSNQETKVIGLGEGAIAQGKNETVKTYSLGSCVAVCMFVPTLNLGAMLHIVLPSQKLYSNITENRGAFYYADAGIQLMLKELNRRGCKYNKDILVKLAGGADILSMIENKIGKKNILAVKKMLWKYRMGPVSEDVGGSFSRTVTLDMEHSNVIINSPTRELLVI
jgi:chemotaxis protein CheD